MERLFFPRDLWEHVHSARERQANNGTGSQGSARQPSVHVQSKVSSGTEPLEQESDPVDIPRSQQLRSTWGKWIDMAAGQGSQNCEGGTVDIPNEKVHMLIADVQSLNAQIADLRMQINNLGAQLHARCQLCEDQEHSLCEAPLGKFRSAVKDAAFCNDHTLQTSGIGSAYVAAGSFRSQEGQPPPQPKQDALPLDHVWEDFFSAAECAEHSRRQGAPRTQSSEACCKH